MKAVLIIALICLTASAKLSYEDFALPLIEKLNANPEKTWTAGVSPYFAGRTMEEIRRLLGSLETPAYLKLEEKADTPINAALPENFDSRTQWPNCQTIQDVRDQSNCGSCWAFGAAEAISDRICIASNSTITSLRISSENLLTCCGFFCGNGCNGGYPSAAWRYWVNSGLVTGFLYNTTGYCQPYAFPPCEHHVNATTRPQCSSLPQYSTPACVKSCESGYATPYTNDLHFGASAYSITGVEKIKQEIFTNGPIEGSFTVYEDFLTYTGGVYQHTTGSAVGGHAIKVIGWGVDNGTPYWLCTNSWNTDWGMNGFFMIKQGDCGINNGMVAGLPKLN